MKGIMLPTFLKVCMVVYFGTYLVSGESSNKTSVTTTTSKPGDLSRAETGHYETSVQLLRPGDSLSRSKSISYSKSNPDDFEHRNPDFEKERYDDRAPEYEKNSRQREEYYNGNGGDSHNQQGPQEQLHHQPEDYNRQSYGGVHEQQNHGNEGRNYNESPEQRNSYPIYPDHSENTQGSYGNQESYEPPKEDSYDGGRQPYLRYSYEVPNNQQQQQTGYDHLDVPDNNGKSGYGSVEAKAYPQNGPQQPEFYPVPNPTRYSHQDSYKGEEYRSDEQKGGYFPAIPKEAGYAPSGQKEPEYLQSPQNEPSYSKQAGYLPRAPEPAAYLPPLPKEKPAGTLDEGKVAVFIKHLGHKSPGSNQYVNKERRGYLLLPVVPEKMEEKLRQLNGHYEGGEYKQAYQNDKEPVSYHTKSPEIEKEIYIQPKVVKYPVSTKVASLHYGSSYGQDQGYVRPQAKSIVSHASYGSFKPIIKHTTYVEPQYESPKVHSYATKGTSGEGAIPYITKTVSNYEEEPEEKSYSGGSLGYGGAHPVIPSYIGAVKYEPATVYGKARSYVSAYDVTSPKSVPIKITGLRQSSYSSLPHEVDYTSGVHTGVSHLASLTKKEKEKIPITSHVYSPQYKNIGARLVTAYESPKLDVTHKTEKYVSLPLPKSKHSESIAFHPSAYSSKGRISAKSLVEDFGLHDYESLLNKQKHGSSVGGLYYDLHTFPARHSYSQYGLRKSGLKYYS